MTQDRDINFYSDLLACHQYALVDRVFTSEQTLEKIPVIPLIPSRVSSDADQMPALMPLDAPYMPRLAARMKAGETDPSCNPIDTLIAVAPHITQKRLVSHLTSRLIFFSPGGKKGYLRYFSSDIFPHLLRILPPTGLKNLFGQRGEVLNWTYRFQDTWNTVSAPTVAEGVHAAWIISREQYAALEIVGEVNEVLDAYREKMDRPWKDIAEWDEKACVIELAIGYAQRIYHLSAPIDLKAFAMHALAYGEHFHKYRAIQQILRDTAPHPGAYHAATSKLTDNEWAVIAV